MGILADCAQLQHIGQHGNGAALAMVGLLGFRQGFKRRLHGSGAGVISVVDKGNIANIDNLLAAACKACRCQRLRASLHIHAVAGSAGDGGKRIIHVVLANQLQAHLYAAARSLFGAHEGGAHGGGSNLATTVVAVFAQAKVYYLGFSECCRLHNVFVIAV